MPEPAPEGYRSLLAQYLKPQRHLVLGLSVVLLGATSLPLLGPALLGRFIDQAVAGQPTSTLLLTAALFVATALAGQAMAVAAAYASSRLAWGTTNRMREDLAEHALALDMSFHGRNTPGEMIQRVDGDVTAVSDFFAQFVLHVVGSLLLLTGVLAVALVVDVRIGLVLVVYVAVASVVVSRLTDRAVPLATATREASGITFGAIEERLAGAEDLRANGGGHHAMNGVERVSRRWFDVEMVAERKEAAVVGVTTAMVAIATAAVLTVGVLLFRQGAISLGTVYLLFQYGQMVRRPLERVVEQLKQLQDASAGANRAAQLLALRPAIVDGGTTPVPDGALAVELSDVTFAYGDDDPVLHDVSVSVTPGTVLGLVGRTGGGKTTIGRLLLRLYETEVGLVRVGGVDVREVPLAELRRRVAVVTQDVQIFSADVRDNLTLFAGGVDDERLVAVLHELGLGEWLAGLPSGLDTQLGAGAGVGAGGGVGMSAGEAQLLAFARVFLRDPGLVVLDEASSRLDPRTEALIERAVDRLLQGRTGILIAHRLSTLERAHDIAVIEGGRIVEHGARLELARDPRSRYGRLLALSSEGAA